MGTFIPISLPTTSGFSYAETSISDHRRPLLLEADSARALVANALKQVRNDGIGSFLEVHKALEEYIPLLAAIVNYKSEGSLEFAENQPLFTWKLPSKSRKRDLADKTKHCTIEFERGMIILSYILVYVGLAQERLDSVTGDNADKSMRYRQATAHLLKAQSITSYLARHPINFDDMPWDIHPTTINMLGNMISGLLHVVVLRKDVEAEMDDYYRIPKSSASMILMTRVAIYSADKFTTAHQLADKKDTPDSLVHWLKDMKLYAVACSMRFMAMQQAAKGKIGNALGYINQAIDSLDTNKMKTMLTGSRAVAIAKAQLKENCMKLQKVYKKENDSVAFQPVPKFSDIDEPWPSGREVVVSSETWEPKPVEDSEHGRRAVIGSDEYAGKGNYF